MSALENFRAHAALVQSFSDRSPGEADTRAHLIDPVLRLLGYSTFDHIRYEVSLPASKDFLDYVLYRDGVAFCIVEAKALRVLLDDQAAAQCVQYAAIAGVRWCLVTNGQSWAIYDAHARGPLAEKHVARVQVSPDSADEAWAVLSLFSRQDEQRVADPLVRLLVQRVVEDELTRAGSRTIALLTKAVRERFSEAVSPGVVLDVLRERHGDFSVSPGLPSEVVRPAEAVSATHSPQQRVPPSGGIADLLAAGLLHDGAELEGPSQDGSVVVALVRGGGIEVAGGVYASPSSAASAVRGGVSVNGWKFWKHRGVTLDELRSRLSRAGSMDDGT